MRILVVEDSPTLRYAMTAYIKEAGHEALIAEDGEKAIQLVESTPIEMIIMDVEMPGLDGFETTMLIREMLGDHWVPIIFVTGRADDKSVELGIEAGGDDYLVKPVSQIILNAKIRALERITDMRNELASLNQDLKHLSQRDGLTQLYNRRTFNEKAEEQWRIATRAKDPFSIILLDIDHFKPYNDRYGHPRGDQCIKEVAKALQNSVNRPCDIVARYGGEEFIAFLPSTSKRGAIYVCETIRKNVENLQIAHAESSISNVVTVSIGASVINFTTSTSMAEQIELADKALYKSKESGRNRTTLEEFEPKCSVLVIDDCDKTLSNSIKYLNGHCKVFTTKNTEEALHIANERQPDLILLDPNLDNGTSFDDCERLREHSQTSIIPLVLISQEPKEAIANQSKKLKANGYLQKPFKPQTLIAKINQFLP